MPRITALLTALVLSCGGLALAAPAASAPSPVTISPVPRLKVGWDGRATLRPVVHKTAAGKRAGVRVTDKRVTVRRAGTVVGKKNRSRAKLRPGTYRVRAKATVVQRSGTAKRTVSRSFRTVVRQGSCPTKADVRTLKVGDALTPGVAGDVRADVDRKLRQKGRSTRHSVADLREELVLTLEQLADEFGDDSDIYQAFAELQQTLIDLTDRLLAEGVVTIEERTYRGCGGKVRVVTTLVRGELVDVSIERGATAASRAQRVATAVA